MKTTARDIHVGIQNIGAMLHCDDCKDLRVLFCHYGTHITLDIIYYFLARRSYPCSIGTEWQIGTVKYVRNRI